MRDGDITFESNDKIRRHLAMLLRDQSAGTTADLGDYTVAYFDGHQVMGTHLSADAPGQLDEDFELTDEFLDQIPEAVEEWLQHPRYTFRPYLLEWLKDAPPFEASTQYSLSRPRQSDERVEWDRTAAANRMDT